jgi:hypothetical protein
MVDYIFSRGYTFELQVAPIDSRSWNFAEFQKVLLGSYPITIMGKNDGWHIYELSTLYPEELIEDIEDVCAEYGYEPKIDKVERIRE